MALTQWAITDGVAFPVTQWERTSAPLQEEQFAPIAHRLTKAKWRQALGSAHRMVVTRCMIRHVLSDTDTDLDTLFGEPFSFSQEEKKLIWTELSSWPFDIAFAKNAVVLAASLDREWNPNLYPHREIHKGVSHNVVMLKWLNRRPASIPAPRWIIPNTFETWPRAVDGFIDMWIALWVRQLAPLHLSMGNGDMRQRISNIAMHGHELDVYALAVMLNAYALYVDSWMWLFDFSAKTDKVAYLTKFAMLPDATLSHVEDSMPTGLFLAALQTTSFLLVRRFFGVIYDASVSQQAIRQLVRRGAWDMIPFIPEVDWTQFTMNDWMCGAPLANQRNILPNQVAQMRNKNVPEAAIALLAAPVAAPAFYPANNDVENLVEMIDTDGVTPHVQESLRLMVPYFLLHPEEVFTKILNADFIRDNQNGEIRLKLELVALFKTILPNNFALMNLLLEKEAQLQVYLLDSEV